MTIGNENPETPGSGTPQGDNSQVNVDKLQRENAELQARLAEKDRVITEERNKGIVLESRLKETGGNKQAPVLDEVKFNEKATEIFRDAPVDPEGAAKRMTTLFSESLKVVQDGAVKTALNSFGEVTNQQIVAAKLREQNADLISIPGMEATIGNRIYDLMQQGKTFKDAGELAIKEIRGALEANFKKTEPPKAPSGSQGESGANNTPKPATPPAKELSPEDQQQAEIDARKAAAGAKGLF